MTTPTNSFPPQAVWPCASTLLYGRVSTGHQQTSIEIQERECALFVNSEYAQSRYGLSLRTAVPPAAGGATSSGVALPEHPDPVQILADEDVSGRIPLFERPQGRRIKELIEAGQVKHLIVAKLDRLGRNATDLLTMWQWFEAHDVKLYVVHDGILPDSPLGGKLMYQFLSIMAEFERDRIHERVTAGVNRRFEKGLVQGQLPYGARAVHPETGEEVVPETYVDTLGRPREKWPAGTLQVEHPEEALWIRQMAGWRALGMGWDKIARQLEHHGVSTKHGGKWSGGKVQRILTGRWVREHILDAEGESSSSSSSSSIPEPLPLAA